ncbi:MAG TPA: response regulator [Gammaproteobacteria bacterium]|nr:response regulator [Gammaproteobacteria bacterium]
MSLFNLPTEEPVDFRRVFEASQDIYALVAPNPPDFTILAVSKGHVQASVRPREEIVDRGFFGVYPQNPEAREASRGAQALRTAFERLLRDKKPNSIGAFRYDIPDPENPHRFHERYWSPQNFPIFDAEGEVAYILHRVEEVTDFVLRERFRDGRALPAERGEKEVLVAEADPERRAYLRGLFETRWEVCTVSTGEEALQRARDRQPDLVYAAMDLPDLSGVALVDALRQSPKGRETPVIIALGRTDPGQFRAALESGAEEVVSGQASPRELIARAEAQLHAAELRRTLPARVTERYHQLFMQAPIAIALMEGPDHVYTLSNPAHDELVGGRPLLGLPARKAYPEPGLEAFFTHLDQVYSAGEPFLASEVPMEMESEGLPAPIRKYVSYAYLPLRDLDGSVGGVAGFVSDVTEEVESRQIRQRKRARQEAIATLGETALWNPPLQDLFDQATRKVAEILEVDLTNILEWKPEEGYLLVRSGTGWKEGVVGSATEPDRRASPGGYTLLTEEPVLISDLAAEDRFTAPELLTEHGVVSGITAVIRGTERPYGVLTAFTRKPRTFTADEGNFLKSLANVLAASIQRAETEAKLRRSEAQFREMADGLPIIVWMRDAAGNQQLANQAMADFCGITREELEGTQWQQFLHPEDAEGYKQELFRCLREQRPFHAETRGRRCDGQWRLLETWGKPRFSESGAFQGLVGGTLDITEQRRAEEQVREADRRKREFLALLGHELRNPLTAIANVAQLLQMNKDSIDRAQQDRVADVLSRQSAHLTRIVDDLLDLSRLDRNQLTLQKEAVDLRELIPQAVESIPALREEEPITLSMTLPDAPLDVEGDRIRMVQMLTNLLDNAAKHTPNGKEIRVKACREGSWVVVRVVDQGTGIDPDFLPYLFDPFERGRDRDTQIMGLGLGLPLVKRLMDLHGGTVEAQSAGPGRGSTFALRFPALSAESGPDLEEELAATHSINRGRVLLVEDNDDVADSLAFLLEGLGQEVRRASSGREALELAKEAPPALVLIDIGLPDMTGFEVAGRLREVLGATALVALSGHPAAHFPDQPTEIFDDHLLKPPTLEALQHALARMADG